MDIKNIKIEDINGWICIVHEHEILGFVCSSCGEAHPTSDKSGWMTGKCWACEQRIEQYEEIYGVPEGDFTF